MVSLMPQLIYPWEMPIGTPGTGGLLGPGAAVDTKTKKDLLPVVGIEFHFLGHPAENLVALLTELFQPLCMCTF
jgi:hypothetical protein